MSNNETELEEYRRLINEAYGGYPSLEAKTLAEKLEELEEEQRKLEEEIENQPIIDIVPEIGKTKEDRLPRKFRKGW